MPQPVSVSVAPGSDVLFGTTPNGNAAGVFGENTGGPGSGAGVVGISNGAHGVHGQNGNGSGLHPRVGTGVLGESDNGFGVYASSGTNIGVFGESQTTNGVLGVTHSNSVAAVSGVNKDGGIGIFGEGGIAGSFVGEVVVTGKVTANAFISASGEIEPRIAALEEQISRIKEFIDLHNVQPVFREKSETGPTLELGSLRTEVHGMIATTFASGHDFLPNTIVTFRVANDEGGIIEAKTQKPTDEHGTLVSEITYALRGGGRFFAATDGRPNPKDWTGFLWTPTLDTFTGIQTGIR